MRKVKAVYSSIIGLSIMGMWIMIILTGGIAEGLIEISFHLVSEFLMALLLLLSGIGLLRDKLYGEKIFLISNGMLIYSVLNAAGYYGQRNNYVAMSMFTVILVISSIFLLIED